MLLAGPISHSNKSYMDFVEIFNILLDLSYISTPYNVGSVLWRLFCTLEVVQYIGGITSVLWEDSFSTVGGIASVLWGDTFSTVEVVQYSGGIASVLWGDSFSTVEVVQYSGGITSVHAGG